MALLVWLAAYSKIVQMLVENGSGQQREKRTLVPLRGDLALRNAFVDALNRGEKSSAIAEKLGIGLSTVYKWRRCWEEYGKAWVAGQQRTRAKCFPGGSESDRAKVIVELSLENPKWGAARLANELLAQYGIGFSTGTVHAILTKHGIATRMARAEKLYERHVTNSGSGTYKWNKAQRELLSLISPFAGWHRGQAETAGFRLVQQLVSIGHASPIGNSLLMVIVDAYDQRAFAKFSDQSGVNPESEFLREILDWYKSRGMVVREVVTNHGYQYSDSYYGNFYEKVLEEFEVQHRFDTFSSAGLRLNPLVKDVWRDLRNHLFKERRLETIAARKKHALLNPIIQEFLDRRFGDG